MARSVPVNSISDERTGPDIDSFRRPDKTQPRTGNLTMRGLLMALFAFDFPGHTAAGSVRASFRSTKTMAKATAKTV